MVSRDRANRTLHKIGCSRTCKCAQRPTWP